MKLGAAEVIAGFEAQRLRFTALEMIEDGVHPARDVGWNQPDVVHVEGIHGSFVAQAPVLADDVAEGVFVLRPLGLRIPLTTAPSVGSGEARESVTSMGPLALVIEDTVEGVERIGSAS